LNVLSMPQNVGDKVAHRLRFDRDSHALAS
jgi:hypothetical protein